MPEPLLQPDELSRVGRLELIARQAVEGLLSGRHRSPHHGSSVEYADHRPYTFGDEVRGIDWKLWAKTDRYFIKLFEDRTNLRCTLLVDTSASMRFAGQDTRRGRRKKESAEPAQTKLRYAGRLAAALGYLMLRQNDAVGLALFDGDVNRYVPARSTARHLHLLVEQLANACESDDSKDKQPNGSDASAPIAGATSWATSGGGGGSGIGAVLNAMAGRIKRRGLVIVLSDLLDDEDAIAQGLAHLRHDRHEVIVLQTLDRVELDLPLERMARFRDMETGQRVVGDPRQLRDGYVQRMGAFIERCRSLCHERRVQHELIATDTPPADVLTSYLKRRASVASRLA